MEQIREDICNRCKDHDCCMQPVWPISAEEWHTSGLKWGAWKDVGVDTVQRLFRLSMKKDCMEEKLKKHPIEWWVERFKGRQGTIMIPEQLQAILEDILDRMEQ